MYARRLQVQERLTLQIADALQGLLKPQEVAVVIEATHFQSFAIASFVAMTQQNNLKLQVSTWTRFK